MEADPKGSANSLAFELMTIFIAKFSQSASLHQPNSFGGYFEEEIEDCKIVNYAQAIARAKEIEADEARRGRPDIKLCNVRIKQLGPLSESFAVKLQQLQQQSTETDHRVSATIAKGKELKSRLELIDIKYPEQ